MFVECHLIICLYIRVTVCARARFLITMLLNFRCPHCLVPIGESMGVTSRCVRRSVMSASKFHRSVVAACGHNGTTGTSRCVRCSVMSAMDFHRSVVSACGHNGTTGTSRCVRRSVMSANKFYRSVVSACVYIHICRNYFQLTLCELIIIK